MFCSVDGAHRDQPSLTHSFPPRRSADRGGDEFVVMVEGGDVALAPSVARRVANALAEPIPDIAADPIIAGGSVGIAFGRSEEHTSELQSLMRIAYAVFCLNKNFNSNGPAGVSQQTVRAWTHVKGG